MKKCLIAALVVVAGCTSIPRASHTDAPTIFVQTEKQFTLGPPKLTVGGFHVLNEIKPFIPDRQVQKYNYIHDYAHDVGQAIRSAKASGESVVGLNKFFSEILPYDQWASKTMFLPQLILRCRDKNGNKVWVIHMKWENYSLPIVKDSGSGTVGVDHVVTYVLDYETGKVVYVERCS